MFVRRWGAYEHFLLKNKHIIVGCMDHLIFMKLLYNKTFKGFCTKSVFYDVKGKCWVAFYGSVPTLKHW